MTREEYFQALYKLHEPIRKQEIRIDAVGKKHGLGSKQVNEEYKKLGSIILAISLPEHELFCELTTLIFTEAIQANPACKPKILETIIGLGKHASEYQKPGWRSVYKSIQSL